MLSRAFDLKPSLTRACRAGVALTLLALAGCGGSRLIPTIPSTPKARGIESQAKTGPGWYAVQLHAHSQYSDGNLTVAQMVAMAKAEGLDALGISDHDTTTHWLDPGFVNAEGLVMLHSQEGSDAAGNNHMGLHGFTGITPILNPGSRDETLAEAVRRQATIVINHPANGHLPWEPLAYDSRAHAIEVWNSWFWTPLETDLSPDDLARGTRLQNEEAIAWWSSLLTDGVKVAPIAASDFHRKPQTLSSPCTLVYAESKTEAALLAAVRAGRTMLVNGPRTERVELTADNDGDGRFEAMVGGTVGPEARVRLHVTGGQGRTLKLLRGQHVLMSVKVPSADYVTNLWLKGADGTAPFIYARLDAIGPTMRAMTGAIYLK